jgi:hypothetical protein
MAGLVQAVQHGIIASKELLWRDRIEGLPDVIVRRDLVQMEQALGVALSLGLLHGFLMGQEGGALSKEDREGAQANVLHRILSIVARALVGESAHRLAQMRQVLIPGFAGFGAQAANLRRASARSSLR